MNQGDRRRMNAAVARRQPQVDKATGEILQPERPSGEDLIEEITGAYLLSKLNSYYAAKRQISSLERQAKEDAVAIRNALEHGQEVYDGETGVRARLQFRQGSPELDSIRLAEDQPELLQWLAQKGGLKLDLLAWKGLAGKAAEIARIEGFVSKGGGSEALVVEKEMR